MVQVIIEMLKALKAFDPDQTGLIEAKKFVEVMLTERPRHGHAFTNITTKHIYKTIFSRHNPSNKNKHCYGESVFVCSVFIF